MTNAAGALGTIETVQTGPTHSFSFTYDDGKGWTSVNAPTVIELLEAIEARSKALAAFAASRNALSAADAKAIADAKVNRADDEAREALQAKRNAAKPEPQAEVAAETESAEPASNEPASADVIAKVEYAQVSAAVLSLVKAKGRDAAVAVLSEFGVGNAKELAEDRWAEALDRLNAELGA